MSPLRFLRLLRGAAIHGGRQVTDVYLLGLATSRNARLVSFDESIPLSAVPQAKLRNLLVI